MLEILTQKWKNRIDNKSSRPPQPLLVSNEGPTQLKIIKAYQWRKKRNHPTRRLVIRAKMMALTIVVKTRTLLETIRITTIKVVRVGEVQNRSNKRRQETISKCLSLPSVS